MTLKIHKDSKEEGMEKLTTAIAVINNPYLKHRDMFQTAYTCRQGSSSTQMSKKGVTVVAAMPVVKKHPFFIKQSAYADAIKYDAKKCEILLGKVMPKYSPTIKTILETMNL